MLGRGTGFPLCDCFFFSHQKLTNRVTFSLYGPPNFQGVARAEKQNIPLLRHRSLVTCEWRDDRSPVETKKLILIVESRHVDDAADRGVG